MFKVLFQILPFIACLVTYGLFLCTVRLGTRARAIGLMILLLCASKFVCFGAFGGDAFAPELPSAVIWGWNWAYSGLLFLCALSLLGAGVRWIVRRSCGRDCPRLAWLVVLPLVAWSLGTWGCLNGAKLPVVEEVTLSFANLPEELDGYRILQISDLHASAAAPRERTEAIVALANEVGADLICLTGDYADGLSRKQFRNIEPIRGLKARDGVLAVTGNHEYYFDIGGWFRKYACLENVRFLENDCVIPRPGLAVGGVSDDACEKLAFLPAPDPDQAFAAATNGEFRVLLQHRPSMDYERILSHPLKESVDLQLSGHTHGGIAPGLSLLVAHHNNGMVRGVYQREDGRTVHVSNGAGQWAGFPMRFFNDPSMTVITLKRAGR